MLLALSCSAKALHVIVLEPSYKSNVTKILPDFNSLESTFKISPSNNTFPLSTERSTIFDNSSYYLIMGLRKQAVEDLALLIDLNESEKESIKRYSQGEALFVCGNRRMRINIAVTQEELDSFGSGGGL